MAGYLNVRPAEAFRKADAAAREAVHLDGTSSEAHCALATARLHLRDWSGAETAFKQALQRKDFQELLK